MENRRLKLTLSIGSSLVVALLFIAAFAVYESFIFRFHELDEIVVEENAQRVYRAFNDHFDVLESKVSDWSAWDDAFKFVTGKFPEFAETNVTLDIMNGLRIDVMAYLGSSLNPIAIRQVKDGKFTSQTGIDLPFLHADNPLIAESQNEVKRGLVKFEGQAALATANVVSKVDGSDPKVGRVIFIRKLDEELLTGLSKQNLLKVTYNPNATLELFQNQSSDVRKLENGFLKLGSEVATAHIFLTSLTGETLGTLDIEIPRRIAAFGERNAAHIIGLFVVFLLCILLGIFLILRRPVTLKQIDNVLQANQKLQQREVYLTALIDSVPGYVSWFDKDLVYQGVNKRLAEDFKLSPKDFVGKAIGFQHVDTDPELSQKLKAFLKSKEKRSESEMFLTQNGIARRFFVCFEKYNDGQGIVVVGIDTTSSWDAEKQASIDRQRAENASRLGSLGEMAGGIAHEINNPLAIISASCNKIMSTIKKDLGYEPIIDTVSLIERTTTRIAKIVTGLRTFAREGSRDPMETLAVATLFQDMSELCSARFKNYNVELRILPVDTQITVSCRSVQIGQVLLNLLNNSFDAIQERDVKWVELKCEMDKDFISLIVTDSGPGIPKDIAAKIMDPFFTTKPVGKGTGLGLSISHGIVREHGGEISLDLNSPNTRFVIRLPRNAITSVPHPLQLDQASKLAS